MAELTEDQIVALQEFLAKSQPSTTVPAQQVQQPSYNFKLGGQSYNASSQEEAQRILDQYDSQRASEVEAERIRATALEQQQQAFQQQQHQQRQASAGDNFDKERYAGLFLNDPREAQRYLLQHDPAQLQIFGTLVNEIQALKNERINDKQEQAASQFLIQHRDDYEATPENFKAISDVISRLGLNWDLQGMNAAYTVANSLNALSNSGRSAQRDEPEADDFQQVVSAPRMRSRRSQNREQDEMSQLLGEFEKLSSDDMKKYLESQTK